METAITIEVLPASYGDCLLVTCPVPKDQWRLLVDTGPDETWPLLHSRLRELPVDSQGRRRIDLAIVSHIDHDHIGGTRLLFGDTSLGLDFGDIWFNARRHLERGAVEGEALSELLGAPARTLPWNEAFAGGPVATAGDGGFVEFPSRSGEPRLTLLSPTPRRLERLASVWDRELASLRLGQSNTDPEVDRSSEFPDLAALAAHRTGKDQSVPNGSSIAILLEHRGASALLAADAFATVLGKALLQLAEQRGLARPMAMDAFKLSHHGSRGNLLVELLGVVSADQYIISTDNSRYGHPHDEALARLVLYGGISPTLCFNYSTERNLRWSDATLQARHSFATRYPDPGKSLVLSVPARNS